MSKILTCVLSGMVMFTAVGVHAAEKGDFVALFSQRNY